MTDTKIIKELSDKDKEVIKRISGAIPIKLENESNLLPSERRRIYYNNNIKKRAMNISKDYLDWLFNEHEDVYNDECEKVIL